MIGKFKGQRLAYEHEAEKRCAKFSIFFKRKITSKNYFPDVARLQQICIQRVFSLSKSQLETPTPSRVMDLSGELGLVKRPL